MKTLGSIFLTIGLTLFFFSSIAQQLVNLSAMGETFYRIKEASHKNIDGSSHLNENWVRGVVKMIGKDELGVDSLNFDVYSNNLLFQNKGITYYVSDNNNIEYFMIGNSKFLNIRISEFKNSFFELLSDGSKIKLLKSYKCVIVKGKPSDGIIPAVNDKYKLTKEYFIFNKDSVIKEYSNSKNNLIKLLNDKKNEIEGFIKLNKINIKNEKGLIEVFNYYNSL